MKGARLLKKTPPILLVVLLAALGFTPCGYRICHAQSLPQIESSTPDIKPESKQDDPEKPVSATTEGEGGRLSRQPTEFRLEHISIRNGAELVTISANVKTPNGKMANFPLVSVVRDTLGDDDPENDRLSYIWMLTYAQPSLRQRLAAAIPFLYTRVANRSTSSSPPPPLLNISTTRQKAWSRIWWFGLQHLILDTHGFALKAASRTYSRNWTDYRTAHVTQALAVLSMYDHLRPKTRDENETIATLEAPPEAPNGEQLFRMFRTSDDSRIAKPQNQTAVISVADSLEIRARLLLTKRTFGGFTNPDKFSRFAEKQGINSRDSVGRNWELLRQSAEAAGLYFEPLRMPDETATHAVLWISKSDLAKPADAGTNLRFLNIANPWTDERLRNWRGLTKVRYFDADGRPLRTSVPGAHPVELIPLAVYGLDNPKIPTLLVDFRDSLNPKAREISHRLTKDVATNILSWSPVNSAYFLGCKAFDWITHRRGMDINQPTRLQSYSQLKLLLSLNSEIDSDLKSEIERRLELVSHDPLANDRAGEIKLAQRQYEALVNSANDPDGLAAKINRDRRAEMTSLQHGRVTRFLFQLGTVLTFGHYVHRETATPELLSRMDRARRYEYHAQFLRAVAASTPQIEVTSNLEDVKRSLQFIAENASEAGASAARAAALIFPRTEDAVTRRLCLDALYKIRGQTAKNELVRIFRNSETSGEWRAIVAEYLRKAVTEDQTLSPARAKAFLDQTGGK